MRGKTIIVKGLIPVIILAAGFAGMQAMVLSKTPPEKEARPNPGTLVETMRVSPEDRPVTVWATGTVQPQMTAEIVPQVSGRVISLAPGFVVGGFFKKDDLLFEIEAIDYELAVEKSRAAVAKAEYGLAQIESQARVARLEWERIGLETEGRPNPLVLYEPQLKNARAALASAQADLKQRLIDIERTKIYAPFNCRIRSEAIDPGQYVTRGKGVAVICGTDTAEIVVPMQLHVVQWLSVPRTLKDKAHGSRAIVSIDVNGRSFTWQGRIDRSIGEVDPKGRMVRLVVSVNDPYGLRLPPDSEFLDLAEGLFVDVILEGRTVSDVIPIPTSALRENSSVWAMDSRSRLDVRKVEVIRREKEKVLIRGGLKSGDRIVLTYLSGAAPGMKLRTAEEE
jgi:RND family efflux transporter MFP subunit